MVTDGLQVHHGAVLKLLRTFCFKNSYCMLGMGGDTSHSTSYSLISAVATYTLSGVKDTIQAVLQTTFNDVLSSLQEDKWMILECGITSSYF